MSNTLDEDYRTVADRHRTDHRPSARPGKLGVVVVLLAFGLMVGISAWQTQQDRPEVEAEREQLVQEIHERQEDLRDLQAESAATQDQIADLQDALTSATNTGRLASQRVENLSMSAGTAAVKGPGIVVTTDNAAGTSPGGSGGGVILDRDLQMLANGLWAAGAEAVAINGHRLTTLSAIRFAGQAITVNYRSLRPPYVVEAIGNPDTLQARLLETEGGQMWLGLEDNFGITFETESMDEIVLPAEPHDNLLYARPAEDR